MSVPGSNLLRKALTIIAKQAVLYYQVDSRILNDVGQYVTTYLPQVTIYGSFQPMPKNMYEQFGLDLQKTYSIFYTLNNIIDIQRDVSNDQIRFNNDLYQCESNNEWYAQDGWKGVLCCLLKSPAQPGNQFGFNEVPPVNDNENFSHGNFNTG